MYRCASAISSRVEVWLMFNLICPVSTPWYFPTLSDNFRYYRTVSDDFQYYSTISDIMDTTALRSAPQDNLWDKWKPRLRFVFERQMLYFFQFLSWYKYLKSMKDTGYKIRDQHQSSNSCFDCSFSSIFLITARVKNFLFTAFCSAISCFIS